MENVTFELAKKLKRKGFPQKTSGHYSMDGSFYYEDGRLFADGGICDIDEAYTAPTISEVLKWFREELNLHINTSIYSDYSKDADGRICDKWHFWSYNIQCTLTGHIVYDYFSQFDNSEYTSYEETALAGIEYVLENLI